MSKQLLIFNFTNYIKATTHCSIPYKNWSCIDHVLIDFSPSDVHSGAIVSDSSNIVSTFRVFDYCHLSGDPSKCAVVSSINCKTHMQDHQSVDWNAILNHLQKDIAFTNF